MNSTGPFLPTIHQPPHDPTSLLLNARLGWQTALMEKVETRLDGSLALALLPGFRRSFDEPGGSLGGLTLPTNTALGPDGSLFLLDPSGPTLKLFDPCPCRFEAVPCFGGKGGKPRQLSNPHGIGICSGNLYICDTGNHRVSVFSLHGLALRGHWAPPASAGLTNKWEPYDIAFDGRGTAYISDGANGRIHRFGPTGCWKDALSGFGKVTHLAMDCENRLYACVEGPPATVYSVDTQGNPKIVKDSPEALVPLFPALPFTVDVKGRLYLETYCPAKEKSEERAGPFCVFDLHGELVAEAIAPASAQYPSKGSYISQALDSRLYRCTWHRVILHGEIPSGTRIRVSTFTAEAKLSASDLANLDAGQWETRQDAYSTSEGEWDCLVRSEAGRYLWLKLEFRGNGRTTPFLTGVEIEYPRLGLRRHLPAVFGFEPVSADFTDRFLSLFDTTLRGLEYRIDAMGRYFDPLSAPATPSGKDNLDFLTWLGTWIGVALDRRWPEWKRRLFLKRAGGFFSLRGTREGLWRLLVLYLGMEPCRALCSNSQPKTRCAAPNLNCAPAPAGNASWTPPPLILEHYRIRRWLFLGKGRLSDQAVLWGKSIVNRSQLDENAQADRTQLIMTKDPYRDPFHVFAHAYTLFVPAGCGATEQARKTFETLLKGESPAHTKCSVHYVRPRFRVGIQATIGFDSAIARIAPGVTLAENALGKDAVLGAPPQRQGGPGFELDRGPRAGPTTLLD
jgi:phage tail-like protein